MCYEYIKYMYKSPNIAHLFFQKLFSAGGTRRRITQMGMMILMLLIRLILRHTFPMVCIKAFLSRTFYSYHIQFKFLDYLAFSGRALYKLFAIKRKH